MTFDHVVDTEVQSILQRFEPRSLSLVRTDRQDDDLSRIHFRWNGLDFHHVIDAQAMNVFVLELSELVALDEVTHPGVIHAALAAMNPTNARTSLNFEMPLLGPPSKQRIEALDVAMTFLVEGAQMVLTDLHGGGFTVVPAAMGD